MADIVLINPAYFDTIYKNAKIKVGVPVNPLLNLAMLAQPAVDAGFKVEIIDLNLYPDYADSLRGEIARLRPKLVGITFTTPLYEQARRLAQIIKGVDRSITLVAGGAHATTLAEEVLAGSEFDIAASGEADFVMRDLLLKDLESVKGIYIKKAGGIIFTGEADRLSNLDELPFPAWQLYELKKYIRPSLSNRFSPPGYLETSRGCPWSCVFCNKKIQGTVFRAKSYRRVVDEIEYMLKTGFKEINILDDTFSTDLERAKMICDEIVRRRLKFPWHPVNGMRVDRVDSELLVKMKKAGCYKVSFGIESGNQGVLNAIGKKITLDKIRQAVNMARAQDFEVFGYFMLGLPYDTAESMLDTIKFAGSLKLDIAKFNITIPLPGTRIFEEWDKQGLIKTKDWTKYNFYAPSEEIYDHPSLSHEEIRRYYRRAYRSFYFTLPFLFRRFTGGMRRKTLFRDILLFFKTNWLS